MFTRNDDIRSQIWEAISGLSEEQLNLRPTPERWSMIQVLRHLNLMESIIVKQARAALEKEQTQTVSVDKKPYELTLDRSHSVNAPAHLQPPAEPEALANVRHDLEASHQALMHVAQDHEAELLRSKSFPHPVFGEMDLAQWVDFASYHEERHLAQIQDIKQRLGVSHT
ncbi:DinB family protein [Paenibacillus sp. UMB7766-LJ446]|uniref:DinB family protein n=1 Tax=Paenibacillus sp. UMB7766-LJ446 TaxID=3046313 RepID=UPI002549FD29|nr:DinB family protein [Paenibacillus sp. UMB7766-LJ446]MDK8189304.1 DinB family protein [Paenibacillus sp. UMB7766-LJ446]